MKDEKKDGPLQILVGKILTNCAQEFMDCYESGGNFLVKVSGDKAITTFNPYYGAILDSAKDNELERFVMTETGFVLQPNILYLGAVNEKAGSDKFVPMLEGKSSTGRLGISVHLTAGVGDIGFKNFWTLEITVEQPVKVYPNMPICQVLFHTVNDIPEKKYSGNYEKQGPLPVGSRMFKNFK